MKENNKNMLDILAIDNVVSSHVLFNSFQTIAQNTIKFITQTGNEELR